MCRHRSFCASGWPAILQKKGSKGEGSDARGKISPFDVSLVDETLQAGPPLLDEPLLVDAVVVPEGQLALQGLARQRGDHDLRRTFTMNSVPNAKKLVSVSHLAVPLQLVSEPLKVRVAPADAGLLHAEHGEVRLEKAAVIRWRKLG